MKYLHTVVVACFVFFSSFTSALDLYIEKDGHSVRVKDGAVSVDTPDTKVQVGKQPAGSSASTNTKPDSSADKIDPIIHAGSSDIEFTNIQQHDLEITSSGAGNITVTGKVENLVATLNGSGDLNLENLTVEKATIKINASGTANLNVRRELNAVINGAGDIYYTGNPPRVIPKIYGAGSIHKK